MARREQRATDDAPAIDGADPDRLGFVCLHLRRDDGAHVRDGPDRGTSMYVLVEPIDPAQPTLFRTRNFHVNAIAPRHGNDPISVPMLAAPLRRVAGWLDAHVLLDGAPRDKAGWVKLFGRTFRFTGGEIVGEFLMSLGYLPGAHRADCPAFKRIAKLKPVWMS